MKFVFAVAAILAFGIPLIGMATSNPRQQRAELTGPTEALSINFATPGPTPASPPVGRSAADWSKWEALGILAEALVLAIICAADFVALLYLIEERKEQREARREEREERLQAAIARQRSDVTCAGVTSILRNLTEEDLCRHLWAGQFRHAGFAFESGLYGQLPEYLRKKSEPFMDEITRAITPEQNQISRRLLVFRFPYPDFEVVLADVCRLNFGNTYLVWDDRGVPMKVPRD